MKISRAILLFLVTLGLTAGTMSATAMATKQAFAKPCPMEQSSKKGDCPCCDDHCDGVIMSCNAKCGSCAAAIATQYSLLIAACAKSGNPLLRLLHEQVRDGPAPPIPIV